MIKNCDIVVPTDADGFIKAGNIITGLVTYEINEDTAFNKITVSLKGNGYIFIKHKQRGNMKTVRKHEDYVDIDYIVYKNDDKGEKIPKGSYMKEFNFILPEDIPPSLKITKKLPKHLIHCYIIYYVRIKFETTGLARKVNKFKKIINVTSLVKPRLPTEPSTHGNQWKLSQLSWKINIVKIKATIDKCVKMPGDKINIEYEVENDTNFVIREVIVKLIEVYTFKANAMEVKAGEDVKNTESRSDFIVHGDTQTRFAEIDIPNTIRSIEHANMISREYFISITLILPKHRDDVVYKIPIQITDDRPPPAYWEVLRECAGSGYQNEETDNFDDEIIDSDDDRN